MELLERVQQRGFRTPVVVMSGGGFAPREELLAMAKACGAFVTIVKPFSPHALRDTISAALQTAAG